MDLQGDIRTTPLYEQMKAKFDIGITIEEGKKVISPFPHAWNKIKDNQCSTGTSNVAIRCGKVNGIIIQ